MKRIFALGAAALLGLGLYGTASVMASAAPVAAGADDQVCAGEKVELSGDDESIDVTAPEGFLISGYCVKAGSANQEGGGPVNVPVDPPAAKVTITHPSGKGISHYVLVLVEIPTPTPTPTPTEPTPTPTEPTPTPTEPTPTPTEPTPTPTEPTPTEPTPTDKPEPVVPTVPNTPDTPKAPEPAPAPAGQQTTTPPPTVLASTGPVEVIGYSMLTLALIGGGTAFIVLARRRLA